MRTRLSTLLLAATLAAPCLSALTPGAARASEFKQYFLVLLRAGPNRGGTPEEIERIQRGHMDNIQRLVSAGKLAIAGPFEDGGELRGLFIFDVPTKGEVETLLAGDPAIQTGRLKPQILTWWSERGRALP